MNYLPILLAAAFFFLNGREAEKSPTLDLGKIAPLLANPDALGALKCVNKLFDKNTPSSDKMPLIFELMGNPFISELLNILGTSLGAGLQSMGMPNFGDADTTQNCDKQEVDDKNDKPAQNDTPNDYAVNNDTHNNQDFDKTAQTTNNSTLNKPTDDEKQSVLNTEKQQSNKNVKTHNSKNNDEEADSYEKIKSTVLNILAENNG